MGRVGALHAVKEDGRAGYSYRMPGGLRGCCGGRRGRQRGVKFITLRHVKYMVDKDKEEWLAALTLAFPCILMIEFLKLFTIVNCDDQVAKETLLPSELSLLQNQSSPEPFFPILVCTYEDNRIDIG
jgi:hypothetical protein